MVIVDTSIWVDAMRAPDERLLNWMHAEQILQHPFVTAEFGMGSFPTAKHRGLAIDLMESFAQLPVIDSSVFHAFVTEYELFGTGVGFADVHLLQACLANDIAMLATRDARLARHAIRLGARVTD